jgi:hypothetical protein
MFFKRKRKRSINDTMFIKLRDKVKTIIGDEIPVYNFPFDLNGENKKIYGLCAMTKELLLVAKAENPKDEISLETYEIKDLYDVNYTKLYGAIALEFRDASGKLFEICRATSGKKNALMDGAEYLFALHKKQELKKSKKSKDSVCPKCGRPYRRNSSTCLHCGGAKKALRNLYNIAKPYTFQLTISMLLFFIVSGLNILVPAINKYLIDDVIKSPDADKIGFQVLFAVVLSIAVTQFFINVFRNRLLKRTF